MKKLIAGIALLTMALAPVSALAGTAAYQPSQPLNAVADLNLAPGYDYTRFKDAGLTLNVYNWGEYMSLGTEEGSLDVNGAFTELTGIKVNYTTFDTNETMYSKLKSGGAEYDIVIPSDYMIGKMIQEDMLTPLNFTNIPNFSMIGDAYLHKDFDPENAYSVPYTWGYVGIIYNTTMVEGTIDSWNALWDETYSGKILMFDNSRDAFAIASKKIGLSLNPSTTEEIDKAAAELTKQRGVVQAYVMDQIFDKMAIGEAAMAPYYAGDAITMIAENPDLAFAVPKEGTNYFVDSICIPKNSANQEAAEMYINFLCETDIAVANSTFIGYSTPQMEAWAALPEELRNNPIAYPPPEILENTETFNVLPDELNAHMDKAWSNMRSTSSDGNSWLIPVLLAGAVVLIIVMFWRRTLKKKRNSY